METDVAPVDAATTAPNESPTQTPSSSSREDHAECKKPDRKRKEPASSSRVLKSILRQRSELAASAHSTQKGCGRKTRQKRVVKFSLDDREDEIHKWNGKRLRCLALDLDRWDCLPYMAMRTINKQKTRQTKRLKFCHSFDDLKVERSPRLEVKSEGSLQLDHSDQKGNEKECLVPATMPEVEPIEKSFFVSRWLQQNSREAEMGVPFLGPRDSSEGMLLMPVTSSAISALSAGPTPSLVSLSIDFRTMTLKRSLSRQE